MLRFKPRQTAQEFLDSLGVKGLNQFSSENKVQIAKHFREEWLAMFLSTEKNDKLVQTFEIFWLAMNQVSTPDELVEVCMKADSLVRRPTPAATSGEILTDESIQEAIKEKSRAWIGDSELDEANELSHDKRSQAFRNNFELSKLVRSFKMQSMKVSLSLSTTRLL